MYKSPGECAYAAYAEKSGHKSLVTGADLPQWASLRPLIRDAWNEAASAVRKFLGTMKAWEIDGDTYAAENADDAMAFAMAFTGLKREEFDDAPEEVPLTDRVWRSDDLECQITLAEAILAEDSFPCHLCSREV